MPGPVKTILAAFVLWGAAFPAGAAPMSNAALQAKLEAVQSEVGLVALGAVVADADGTILASAVTGERRRGSGEATQISDAWHIGSNTKMLTALLYARLVEAGEAKWGATLPDLFPDLAAEMDPAWRAVTIEHLLSHRSGLAANPGAGWFISSRFDTASMTTQRTKLAKAFLSRPPPGEVGAFQYSNLGFMIAGAALDRIAADQGKRGYEALFLAQLAPKGEGWGFGPPPRGIEGHATGLFGGLKAQGKGEGADNPPALAPAGTLHIPLKSHARFLSQFLKPDAALQKLLAPYPDEASDYALGWGVVTLEPLGRVYTHNGSNTMWMSTVMLVPEAGLVVIVNTNSFSDAAAKATTSLAEELALQYAKSPPED